MKRILILCLIVIASCTKEVDVFLTNSNPTSFQLLNVDVTPSNASISWTEAIDEDEDVIYYKLYVNSILAGEYTTTSATIGIDFNNVYECRIIATDKKGGVQEISFDFESQDSQVLYFSDSFSKLNAYDLINDRMLWSKNSGFIEAHSVYKNSIITSNNGLIGLNLFSGEAQWFFSPTTAGQSIAYRDFIVDEGNLYTRTTGKMYKYDIDSDQLLWETNQGYSSAAVLSTLDQNNLYIVGLKAIKSVSKESGAVVWERIMSHNIRSSPLVHNNSVYFGTDLGTFYSLDKTSGNTIWSTSIQQFDFFRGSPTLYENTIIAATLKKVVCFDLNGNILWEHGVNDIIESSPFIYEGKVYVGVDKNGSGEVIALNADNGDLVWSLETDNKISASPIVHDDVLYIGDWSSTFYFINANNGQIIKRLNTQGEVFKSATIVIGNSKSAIYPSSHGLKN